MSYDRWKTRSPDDERYRGMPYQDGDVCEHCSGTGYAGLNEDDEPMACPYCDEGILSYDRWKTRSPEARTEQMNDDSPPPPICVFCNAPWTDDMLKVQAEVEMYDGYYGESWVSRVDAYVDVTCSTCKRLVYRKELRDIPR